MSKTLQLSALRVGTAPVGMHSDGHGLYLQVTTGTDGTLRKSWIYKFGLDGRTRHMGLGSLDFVSLSEAREKALAAGKLRLAGIDPIEARTSELAAKKAAKALEKAKAMTFDEAATAYIKAHRAGWKSAKHHQQWLSSIRDVSPVIGGLPVQAIDTALVMQVLDPIWASKNVSAGRLRARLESVLDWAKSRGYRDGENPARWKGHLEYSLPSPSKVHKPKHHPHLPYAELPSFMVALREQNAISAKALEFLIATATRTSETLGAKWSEIDDKVWIIPGERMKAGREHRIPLNDPAIAILGQMKAIKQNAYVFPGVSRQQLSSETLLALLDRMGRDDITAHGFRSTFSTWAAERSFPREVVEMSLAHSVGTAVERSYMRSDLISRRRDLMTEWGVFCG